MKLGTTVETTFTHESLNSYAGRYKIKAIDTLGRESAYSNKTCKYNCIYFMLPNTITPNGDRLNDTFRPDKKSLFIRSMRFNVFRWGVKVYEGNDLRGGKLDINWEGVDNNGNRLPDGIYYYEAEVGFYFISPENTFRKHKGWVEIVR